MTTGKSAIKPPAHLDSLAWRWMRFSAFLLIPLVWVHSILQALITGGHNLSLDYVQMRWTLLGWRVYDVFLLAFALSHGVNGLRQVLLDFTVSVRVSRIVNWFMILFWLVLTIIGGVALVGGVKGL